VQPCGAGSPGAGPDPDPAPAALNTLPRVTRFRVAGLTLALRARRPTTAIALPPPQRAFACTSGGDIRLELTEEPVPDAAREDLVFDSGSVWRVYHNAGGLLYTFRTPVLDPPIYKAVAIDADLKQGRLHYPQPRRGRLPRHALDFPLDELLFQHRLAREGAVEVHACGLIVAGRAVLFCGRSGAGKSTTARLWRRHRRGTQILSDDRIVIRRRGGRLWAYGTPWHGDGGFASPLGRPLRAVFFLRHAPRERIQRIGQTEAAARLFSRGFPPPWDGAALGRVLESCAAVAAGVPCFELRFRPERAAVAAVLDALGEA
jgi:hypothetical protein